MKTLLSICALALFALSALGQTPSPSPAANPLDIGITPNLALGDVTAVDAAGHRLTLKTKDGDIAVMLDEKTEYKRVKPGETSLKNAEAATLADIGVGDRVLAQGKVADDKKSVPAKRVVLMTKAAIAQKQEHDRQEWLRRGIVGRINALNAATKEITLMMRAPGGERPITIASSNTVVFRRYAPDSVRFSDARPSTFDELKVGDQVRALGERSADGARFTPEEIVSGSFRMVGGAITAVNAEANEITINNLQTNQPVTIVVNKDSLMRRIPAEMAAMIAQRRAQAAGGGAPGAGTPPAAGQGGGAGEGGGPGRGGDFDAMLERLPPVAITDLKKGDIIAVSSTTGANPTRVTAIKLVAGIEALMTRPQGQTGQGSQSPSLNVPGLDSIGGP
ncbi:MAG: hypothetical protein JO360_08700 [Acidobacteria bacterium]|nr:hypothetical protein [Acidobacteriota bacterium]